MFDRGIRFRFGLRFSLHSYCNFNPHSFFLMRANILFCVLSSAIALSLSAKPVPENLGNGLDKLVTNNLIQQGKITAAPLLPQSSTATKSTKKTATRSNAQATTTTTTQSFATYKAMIAKQAASYAWQALTDATTGKYLVEIMPNGRVPVTTLQSSLQTKFPLLGVTATDTNYIGHGVIEGYVSIDDVPAIAQTAGVGSVILQLRPIHRVGAVTEFGVN